MTHGHISSHHEREAFIDVSRAVVLNVGAFPNHNGFVIAPEHRVEPNARTGRNSNIPRQHGSGGDESVCIDNWFTMGSHGDEPGVRIDGHASRVVLAYSGDMEQQGYQVRFGFGLDGLTACASDADIIVWVDALPTTLEGERTTPAPREVTLANLLAKAPVSASLIAADVPTSRAAAEWVVTYQEDVGRRLAIAVIASHSRFAVDDFLAAGAVIDALAELGLDATSPEAASAESAYRGLSHALAHVLTASVAGRAATPEPTRLRIDPLAGISDVAVIRDLRL